MRSVLDPKHFYKKNDLDVLPKYFQVNFCLFIRRQLTLIVIYSYLRSVRY